MDHLARWMRLFLGFLLFAVGIVLLVKSGLGASPWDVLHTGVQSKSGLSLGSVVIASAAVVCAGAATIGVRPGPATYANMVAVGVFVDLLNPLVDPATGVVQGIGFMFTGILSVALATGVYAGARLGLGPRDSLMVAWHRRFRSPLWWVRLRLEGSAVVVGLALEGEFGVGTFVFAVVVGPAAHLAIRWLAPDVEYSTRESHAAGRTPPCVLASRREHG